MKAWLIASITTQDQQTNVKTDIYIFEKYSEYMYITYDSVNVLVKKIVYSKNYSKSHRYAII